MARRVNEMVRGAAIAAFLGAALSLGGCNSVDLDVDAPILEAAGISLTKKKVNEDLPERAEIVIPPSTDTLPEPGSRKVAANSQAWPQDADQIKAQQAKDAAAKEEEYCRNGDWSSDANIDEFDKNIGKEAQCSSKLGKAISKSFGGGPASQ